MGEIDIHALNRPIRAAIKRSRELAGHSVADAAKILGISREAFQVIEDDPMHAPCCVLYSIFEAYGEEALGSGAMAVLTTQFASLPNSIA